VRFQGGMIVISLGSNLSGAWGPPGRALHRTLNQLEVSGIQIIHTSKIYKSRAQAYLPLPDFLNAVAIVQTPMPADALLQVLKRIEAQAGRRFLKITSKNGREPFFLWNARPLDLDIVSFKGVVCNWEANRPKTRGCVILPHPRAHERAFVLHPLSEIAPYWHHPVFGLTAAQLLKRPAVRKTGEILSCEGGLG
jgi:2-amino-4-hydroxy-6-hydroxymethyldihydropteridine diphosphokinase